MSRVEGSFYPLLRRSAAVEGAFTLGTAAAAGGLVAWGAMLSAAFPIKVMGLVVLLGLLCAPSLAEHGRPTLGLANRITLARAVLVGLIAAFLGEPGAERFSLLLVGGAGLAFALDWVDGQVARRLGSASPFGARLDMELDGLTVLALSALAWQLDRAGAWVLWAGSFRYLFLGAAWFWPPMRRPLPPTPRRPWLCGVAITALVFSVAPWPDPAISSGLAAGSVGALALSFGIDVAWLVARRNLPLRAGAGP